MSNGGQKKWRESSNSLDKKTTSQDGCDDLPSEYVHTPVMLKESLEALSPAGEDDWMVDCTLGEGGHSEAFLKQFPRLNIIGLDADSLIIERAKKRLAPFGERMHYYNGWFNDYFRFEAAKYPMPKVILFDLGVSVFHYTVAKRGFSFLEDDVLDMRLNKETQTLTAKEIVNEWTFDQLVRIFSLYAQEHRSKTIARAIIKAREEKEIVTAKELGKIIYDATPNKDRYKKSHPATKVFMAIRIAVNDELSHLGRALLDAFNRLEVGGRLGVITFHSTEDRIVKKFFSNLGRSCVCPPNIAQCTCGGLPAGKILTKKALLPSDNEVATNKPSRSAQLRVVEKLHNATDYHILGLGDISGQKI